jgi:hypothetical protein
MNLHPVFATMTLDNVAVAALLNTIAPVLSLNAIFEHNLVALGALQAVFYLYLLASLWRLTWGFPMFLRVPCLFAGYFLANVVSAFGALLIFAAAQIVFSDPGQQNVAICAFCITGACLFVRLMHSRWLSHRMGRDSGCR